MSPGPTPPHVSVATNARSTTPLTTSDGDGGRGVRGAGPAGRRARRAVRAAAPGRRRRARPLQPVQASTAAPYACGRPTAARPARRATARIAASLSAVLSPPRARDLPSAMVGRGRRCTAHPLTALPVVPRAIWHAVCPHSLSADSKDVPVEGGFAGHPDTRTPVGEALRADAQRGDVVRLRCPDSASCPVSCPAKSSRLVRSARLLLRVAASPVL